MQGYNDAYNPARRLRSHRDLVHAGNRQDRRKGHRMESALGAYLGSTGHQNRTRMLGKEGRIGPRIN